MFQLFLSNIFKKFLYLKVFKISQFLQNHSKIFYLTRNIINLFEIKVFLFPLNNFDAYITEVPEAETWFLYSIFFNVLNTVTERKWGQHLSQVQDLFEIQVQDLWSNLMPCHESDIQFSVLNMLRTSFRNHLYELAAAFTGSLQVSTHFLRTIIPDR